MPTITLLTLSQNIMEGTDISNINNLGLRVWCVREETLVNELIEMDRDMYRGSQLM